MTNIVVSAPLAASEGPETPFDKSDLLRSSARECLNAAEETKYRAIRVELRQLAETYLDRALITQAGTATKSG